MLAFYNFILWAFVSYLYAAFNSRSNHQVLVSYYAHASTHSRHKKAGANPGKIVCSLQLVGLIASLVQGHALDGKHGGRLISINEGLSLD